MLALCITASAAGVVGQEQEERNLRSSLEQAEAHWLIGTWEHQDPDGDIVRLVFSWDLGDNAILDHVVAPGRESRGISARDPVSGRMEYFGVDDRGGLATGWWSFDADKWVLRGDAHLPDGSLVKIASIHTREGQDSMELKVYRVGAEGEMQTPPLLTRRYERRR